MLKPPEVDLRGRDPVWTALSELFLDISLDASDTQRIAQVLAASSYDLDELEEILLDEVYPACRPNLFVVAGEWVGFDPEWLRRRILRRQSWFERRWVAVFGRGSVKSSKEWRDVKATVAALRGRSISERLGR